MENSLKELRKKAGISQMKLARELGITASGLSRYESGNRKINPDIEKKILDYFNIDYNTLYNSPLIDLRVRLANLIEDFKKESISEDIIRRLDMLLIP